MFYQVYDWVTWKVIINRTTWLNTNDIITWHHCLGKEPVLLQRSPANQTLLYSITVNSAISTENVGGSAISTASSLVPPLPAQPLGGSMAILTQLLLHTLPEQAPRSPPSRLCGTGTIYKHLLITSSAGQRVHRKLCKSFPLPLFFF